MVSVGARQVIVVDNQFLGRESNLEDARSKGCLLYRDDVEIPSSLDYVFDRHSIDVVFNCATKALNYSFLNPRNAFDTNVQGVLNLLELQRKGRFETLVHFSTSEVYGTAVYEPMDEQHPVAPTTTYAAGKAAADLAVASYVGMFDLDAFVVRPFNNYGPRQNHEGALAGIIPSTICRILRGEAPEIHGTGQQSRDFIYVLDMVDAVMGIYGQVARGDSVNIATNGQLSVNEVVERIGDAMGYGGPVVRGPARGADVDCHNASNAKIRSMIDYQLTPFDEGLATTIQWYRDKCA